MNLSINELQAFALAELSTFNLLDFSIDKNRALTELQNEISSEWNELNSLEIMESRHKYFNIPHTDHKSYSERLIDLGSGKKLIYGIRHMGGHREIPFISVRSSFELASREEALWIFEKLKNDFAPFKPLYLCFWSKTKMDVDFIGSTYLVSSSKEMKDLPQWEGEKRIEFRKVSNDSYYAWYKQGYEIFHNNNPDLEKKVTLNTLESMESSKKQGLLQEVYLTDENGEKERLGLIAAEKIPFLGSEGIYFHEIFIDKKWQGQGLAKAIQRKFISLFSIDNDLIWGTIDDSNKPSYKTALANGRKPIRFECFVKLKSS